MVRFSRNIFCAHIWKNSKGILNQHIFRVVYSDRLIKEFLYYVLNRSVAEVEQNLHGGVGLVHITKGNLEKIEIPIPPKEIQKRIVDNIEYEEKIVDSNRQLIENYNSKIKMKIESVW